LIRQKQIFTCLGSGGGGGRGLSIIVGSVLAGGVGTLSRIVNGGGVAGGGAVCLFILWNILNIKLKNTFKRLKLIKIENLLSPYYDWWFAWLLGTLLFSYYNWCWWWWRRWL
jgi:hypothetical protein